MSYSSYTVKFIIFKCTVQCFLVYSQHYASITTIWFQNIFITSKRNPRHISSQSPLPSSMSPWQPLICFLSLWISLLWAFCIKGTTRYAAFCVWLIFRSHPVVTCISTSFLLYDWIIFHCVDIPLLFNRPLVDGHLGCSHFLIINNGGVNSCAQVLVWICFRLSWTHT